MSNTVNYNQVGVPTEYTGMVARLRDYLDDTVAQNDLEGIQESSDQELYRALEDTWDEVNTGYPPHDLNFAKITDIPWSILRAGATLNVLESKGLGSARNTLTYSDAGGITIKDQDKFGRYTVWYNAFLATYRRRVSTWKAQANLSAGFGGVYSEYNDNWW